MDAILVGRREVAVDVVRRQGDVATRSKTVTLYVKATSKRRLNDFKSTSDRRRVDVSPTKDDIALTSSRRRLAMWAAYAVYNITHTSLV